jgi:FAD/FMN-containing dehydrogenase
VADQRVVTIRGSGLSGSVLQETLVNDFKASLQGMLMLAGDPGYDDARHIWNGMIDKRPALIARCRGVADIINSVNFAREHGLLLAVRGGGHNVAGNATCDGGFVIDLSEMRSIRVDPAQRTARAEAGAT